jgi:2-polyprenyl-3-methyl-5-hydroxy-6-metoxy-1,4-benzoquinol methylase
MGPIPSRICDLCGDTHYTIAPFTRRKFDKGWSAIGICKGCGLTPYVSTLPNNSDRILKEDYYDSFYRVDDGVAKENRYNALAAERVGWIERHATLAGKTVLDIGSGEGQLLKILKSKGAVVTGVEPMHRVANDLQRQGLDVFPGLYEEFAAQDSRTFDIVTLYYVLDLTQRPASVLRSIRQRIASGGLLYIHTGSVYRQPFFSANGRLLRKSLAKLAPRKNSHEIHPYYFTRAMFQRLLRATGFNVVSISAPRDKHLTIIASPMTPVPLSDLPRESTAALWWSFVGWRLFDATVRPVHRAATAVAKALLRR